MTRTSTSPRRNRHRAFQAGALAMTIGTATLFSGVVGATEVKDPTLIMGPNCESGESVMRYEVSNSGSGTETLVLTIGGQTVVEGVQVGSGETATGSVLWPYGMPRGDDVETVASWAGTTKSTTMLSRGDMCSNPPMGLPSRGPEFLAGFVCIAEQATLSFRLTNNDVAPHDMDVAISDATFRESPETIVWPAVGGTLSLAPGESIVKDGIAIPAEFPVGSQLRARGWWRTADSATHNRVWGVVPDCSTQPEPTTTTSAAPTTVIEPTTTLAEPTTTVAETTTTVAETTTTVAETTTTVAETTTTVPTSVGNENEQQTTTTIGSGVGDATSTVPAPTAAPTTKPMSTSPVSPRVGGTSQAPAVGTAATPNGLAVTGGDTTGRTLGGGALLLLGAALMVAGRRAGEIED